MKFSEIIRMALGALRTNRLRSALTMLGVTIGVFSVIGVMTALSVIGGSIEHGLSFLGSNIFQFAKYPVVATRDPHEQFKNRRNITLEEGNEYKRLMEGSASAVCLKVFDGGAIVAFGGQRKQGVTLVGTNEAFTLANSYSVAYGRNLTPEDVALGRAVAVIGPDIQKRLFMNETPLNKTVKVNAKPYQVIGVFAEKGSSFGQSQDDICTVPITKFFSDFGRQNRTVNVATQSSSQATYRMGTSGYAVLFAICGSAYLVAFALNHLLAPRFEPIKLRSGH